MRAAVLYGKEQIRVEEIPPPPLRAGEVRLRIEAALTCGTDLKVFKRGYHAKMIVPPALFGHELAGTIAELAADVAGWHLGERVAAANSAPCGDCAFCRQGQENLCDDLLFLNGAYAESIVVPARVVAKNLLRLKPTTPFPDAALVEPLACVVQGAHDCDLRAGTRVLVIGAGPIGLMFLRLARHLGGSVTVAGRNQARLETARRLGADAVISVADVPTTGAAVRAHTNDQFDVVIEATGRPEAWEAAVVLVRKGGLVNFFGGCPAGATVRLDTGLIHYSNLTLRATFHHTPRSVRRALELIEARVVRAQDFVGGQCPLSHLPQLFRSLAETNQTGKTLIRVHE